MYKPINQLSKIYRMNIKYTKIENYINNNTDTKIVLLREKEVIQWLYGDLSYLPVVKKQTDNKNLEDKWGQQMLKKRRPDLKLDKQWTNKFGEHICEELYLLQGKIVKNPVTKNHYKPDLETEEYILEAKAGTYYTTGTAGEKILGCPFKYAEVPDLYSKPLLIVCIGGAEKLCRHQYGNLDGDKCSIQKQKFLDFFRENKIEYVGATDILESICNE